MWHARQLEAKRHWVGQGHSVLGHHPVALRLLALLCVLILPVTTALANDGYYRTYMPALMPPPPVQVNQPGFLNRLQSLHAGRGGRVHKMVIMSDEPRQAVLSALQNPCMGVTMASYALTAGLEAERVKSGSCVDLYFEGVAFSWHFLQSKGAAARPEYSQAWQLYHESLARLLGAGQRFGRLDPSRGLRVETPVGPQTIPVAYHGFVWKPADFTRVEMIDHAAPKKLKHHYSCPGLGVPLVVVRQHRPKERFMQDEMPFNATAILRPSLAVLAGQAPPLGAKSSHGPLELYDPLRVRTVKFKGQCIAMATDTSAALEYGIRNTNYSPWAGVVRPGSAEAGQEQLFMIEPYQAGKYPIVFVHGFYSSPRIWAHFANEIMARPELRDRVQLMAYRYPTGRPFLESAAILRRELLAMKEQFDPRGEDPGIANTAVIGHSMGGLIAKLLVTYSDDRLWYSIAKRPLSEINVSDSQRRRLEDPFYFEPVPFVRRVVFMGTPHGGAQLASQTLGRWSSKHVQLPSAERIEHHLLITENPGVFKRNFQERIPTSIDLMEPNSCLLKTIRVLTAGQNVQLHNIVGVGLISPLSGKGDGVVALRSAQHHYVSTEKRIHTTHGGLHERDEAMKEIECILRRHIMEANDVPSVDGYEFAVPETVIPGGMLPNCEDVCPDLECPEIVCPDLACPEIECPDGLWPEELRPDYSYPDPVFPTVEGSRATPSHSTPGMDVLPPRDTTTSTPDVQHSILVPHATPPAPAMVPLNMPPRSEPSVDSTHEKAVLPDAVLPDAAMEGPEFFWPEL